MRVIQWRSGRLRGADGAVAVNTPDEPPPAGTDVRVMADEEWLFDMTVGKIVPVGPDRGAYRAGVRWEVTGCLIDMSPRLRATPDRPPPAD